MVGQHDANLSPTSHSLGPQASHKYEMLARFPDIQKMNECHIPDVMLKSPRILNVSLVVHMVANRFPPHIVHGASHETHMSVMECLAAPRTSLKSPVAASAIVVFAGASFQKAAWKRGVSMQKVR